MPTTNAVNIPHSIRTVYSKEILREAKPKMFFAQFAKKKQDLKKNAGETVSFTKFADIGRGGVLTEGTPMGEKALSDSEVTITVTEYGNAVSVSEKALKLSMHDILQEASIALGNDLAIVLDSSMRDVALSTANFVYAQGKIAAGDLVAGDAFDTQMIKDAVEALETNNSPKIVGEYYICVAHPHQLRQLRDDSAWINVHNYHGIEEIYKGEVGMYESVRFVTTTQMPALTSAEALAKYGNSIPMWEGVIFGENSFGWAEALEVEMRSNGVEDYGRKHGIAWYAMWGFGIIEEKNIFTLLSA